MNNFTKEEQLGLLKRGLTRRLVGANPAILEKESEIEKITNVRKEFVNRVEKYADDDVVVNMLNAQLSEYDRQYAGTKQNYLNSIEEIKESEPTVKKVLKYIEKVEKGNKDGTLLYLLLDLFFQPVLTDWHEMEESMKEETTENDNASQ
jgi:polyribonucleotide nucleotidyltransferase